MKYLDLNKDEDDIKQFSVSVGFDGKNLLSLVQFTFARRGSGEVYEPKPGKVYTH